MSPEMVAGTGVVRGIVAGVLLVAFLALWSWAYSARRRSMFEAISRMPLEEDMYHSVSGRSRGGRK
jgi:cbb3-type cytochrome oxidase subunit 3